MNSRRLAFLAGLAFTLMSWMSGHAEARPGTDGMWTTALIDRDLLDDLEREYRYKNIDIEALLTLGNRVLVSVEPRFGHLVEGFEICPQPYSVEADERCRKGYRRGKIFNGSRTCSPTPGKVRRTTSLSSSEYGLKMRTMPEVEGLCRHGALQGKASFWDYGDPENCHSSGGCDDGGMDWAGVVPTRTVIHFEGGSSARSRVMVTTAIVGWTPYGHIDDLRPSKPRRRDYVEADEFREALSHFKDEQKEFQRLRRDVRSERIMRVSCDTAHHDYAWQVDVERMRIDIEQMDAPQRTRAQRGLRRFEAILRRASAQCGRPSDSMCAVQLMNTDGNVSVSRTRWDAKQGECVPTAASCRQTFTDGFQSVGPRLLKGRCAPAAATARSCDAKGMAYHAADRVCLPTDAWCEAQAPCKAQGLCRAIPGQDWGARCAAVRHTDCAASEACSRDKRCMATKGYCTNATSDQCRRDPNCYMQSPQAKAHRVEREARERAKKAAEAKEEKRRVKEQKAERRQELAKQEAIRTQKAARQALRDASRWDVDLGFGYLDRASPYGDTKAFDLWLSATHRFEWDPDVLGLDLGFVVAGSVGGYDIKEGVRPDPATAGSVRTGVIVGYGQDIWFRLGAAIGIATTFERCLSRLGDTGGCDGGVGTSADLWGGVSLSFVIYPPHWMVWIEARPVVQLHPSLDFHGGSVSGGLSIDVF